MMTPLLGTFAADQSFFYHPSKALLLGGGLDMEYPVDTKEDCVDYAEAKWVESDSGVNRVQFSSSYVTDARSIVRNTKTNASLEASYKYGAGSVSMSAGYGLNKKYAHASDSLNYMIRAEYDFGTRRALEPVLKEKYQTLIDENKMEEFKQRCGTHFVISERKGANASILIKVENLSKQEVKDLRFNINVSGKYTGTRVSAAYSRANFVKVASSKGEVKIDFDAQGGRAEDVAAFASAQNDIVKHQAAMENYMKGITRETSAPQSYKLVSFDRFGYANEIKPSLERNKFLEEAYIMSLEYESMVERLRVEQALAVDVPDTLRYFEGKRYRYDRANNQLHEIVKGCLNENKCSASRLVRFGETVMWLGQMLKDYRLETACYYTEGILDTVRVKLVGEFTHREMVAGYDFLQIFETGERSYLDMSEVEMHPTLSSFSGDLLVLQTKFATDATHRQKMKEARALKNQLKALKLVMEIDSQNGDFHTYRLDKKSLSSCPIRR